MTGIPVLLARLMAFAGVGGLCLGSIIALSKCLFWLHSGVWRSIDVRSGLLWVGLDPGLSGERGLDQILYWVYGQSLEVALAVTGLIIFGLSMRCLDARRGEATSTRPLPRNQNKLPPAVSA
jgi:hypothetical protein